MSVTVNKITTAYHLFCDKRKFIFDQYLLMIRRNIVHDCVHFDCSIFSSNNLLSVFINMMVEKKTNEMDSVMAQKRNLNFFAFVMWCCYSLNICQHRLFGGCQVWSHRTGHSYSWLELCTHGWESAHRNTLRHHLILL